MDAGIGISGKTRFVCLLGNPTEHSLSPAMHNLSFKLLGIDAVYTCFDVNPEGLRGVVAAFKAMERWDGFNLTMPLKQAVIPHLDDMDDAAQLIGAVNIVKKDAGRAVGCNTDGVGFVASLAREGVDVAGTRVVVLGPGGAGSAIMAQVALDGAQRLDVFARRGGASWRAGRELGSKIAARTACGFDLHDFADEEGLAQCIQQADILVNATPVGMGESSGETPVSAGLLKPGLVVADAIYHPRETRLIEEARQNGCHAIPGLGMLIEQAAAGEEIWYGAKMPVAEIESALFG